jgi:hypothetical protein
MSARNQTSSISAKLKIKNDEYNFAGKVEFTFPAFLLFNYNYSLANHENMINYYWRHA